jgi:hypothetical protein
MYRIPALVLFPVAFAFAIACAPAADGDELVTETDSQELSTFSDTVVSMRRDTRTCAAPACGGYFVRDVNLVGAEAYVRALELPSSWNVGRIALVRQASFDKDVLLRGKLGRVDASGTRPFVVREAFRAVAQSSGTAAPEMPVYYTLAGAGTFRSAVRVNVGTFGRVSEVTAQFDNPSIDTAQALTEVYERGAIVAGSYGFIRPWAPVLQASQVFLRVSSYPLTPMP